MNFFERKIVYTFMCLDLPHIGHINFIKRAKKLGDILVVGILTDDVIASYKRKPVMTIDERTAIAKTIRYIDKVVEQCDLDPTYLLKVLNPDVLCHADDWTHIPGEEWMKNNGKEVMFVPYYKSQSTSRIINKILKEYK